MPRMTFRFTTECEMTLEGNSYEEIYLKFKDFQHGDRSITQEALVTVCPAEREQLFFALDNDPQMYEIPQFKGSYPADIVDRCPSNSLQTSATFSGIYVSAETLSRIPDVYN